MNTDILLKGFFAVIYSSICAWVVFSRYDGEIGAENTGNERQRYLPYIPSVVLPGVYLSSRHTAGYGGDYTVRSCD